MVNLLASICGNMKLKQLHIEGVVAAARGDILNIVNRLASRIAHAADVVFEDPDLQRIVNYTGAKAEFASSEENPAVVNIALGQRTPEHVAVTVYGDGGGEIKLEISARLSSLLPYPRTSTFSSLDEVVRGLSEIAVLIRDKAHAGH